METTTDHHERREDEAEEGPVLGRDHQQVDLRIAQCLEDALSLPEVMPRGYIMVGDLLRGGIGIDTEGAVKKEPQGF